MKYKLEIDDENSCFEGWAFLHFSTPLPGYALADSLNRLYDYRLQRIDGLAVGPQAVWPLYRHEDPVRHLIVFLLVPTAPTFPWLDSDKLLIVKGRIADVEVDSIYTDFTTPPHRPEGDLLAREHADLLDSLLAAFTIASPLDLSQHADKNLWQHCNTLLSCIEQRHLDLGNEERELLELTMRQRK
mgnify:CR=1 FL=1